MTARLSLLAAATVAVLLGSCSAIGSRDWDWARLAAQCKLDNKAVWLEPVEHLDDLLVIGDVKDPGTMSGRIEPLRSAIGGGDQALWLDRAGLPYVDVFIRPGARRFPDSLGPYDGEPEGVYRFEKLAAADGRCAPYFDWWRTTHAQLAQAGQHPATCVSYRYMGPLQPERYSYIYLSWQDAAVEKAQVGRWVHEIRRGIDHPVARVVVYSGFEPLRWAPDCFHRSEYIDSWFAPSQAGAP